MRLDKTIMLGAVLSLVVGCNGGVEAIDDMEYQESLPDVAGLSLEVNESSTHEGRLVAEGFAEYAAALEQQQTGAPEYLEGARLQVKALNTALKQLVTRVVELSNGDVPESMPGDVLMYGPRDGADATWRLQVKKTGLQRFAWKLEARPLGSTDDAAYVLVGAGRMVRGEAAHRGRGSLGLNLDNYKAVAPGTTGQGRLLASFAHPPAGGKVLAYRLAAFTPNPANHEAVTGAFVGHKLVGGLTRIRVISSKNLPNVPNATDAKETYVNRVRFKPGVGGRADVVVFGGDVPQGQFYFGVACWDAQESEKFKLLRLCTRQENAAPTCTVVQESGARAACPADAFLRDAEPPMQSPDPNDTAPEEGAPESPEAVPSDVTADF
jgi:hypothetical protein